MSIMVGLSWCGLTHSQVQQVEVLPGEYNSEDFFNALKGLKIAQIEEIVSKEQSWDPADLRVELINVYTGGRFKSHDSITSETDVEELLLYLIKGFDVINDPQQTKLAAYQSFSAAIQLSNDLEFNEGLKFSLKCMLTLLKREVFMNTEKFIPYLDHYKELPLDFTDQLIVSLLEIHLRSKENADFKSIAEENEAMIALDDLYKNVSETHPLKGEYYYTKAIQAKLKKNLQEAVYYLHKTNRLVNKKFQKEIYTTTFWQLSSTFLLEEKSDSALYYLNLSKKYSIDPRSNYYDERLASWIFRQIGDMDSAYYYLDKSIKSEYKWDAKKNSLGSGLLAVENQTEKLKLDKLRLDNRRKTNQNYLILAIAALLLGTITAIFLQKNTTKKRKLAEQEALLEQQKVETLLKKQELVSIDAMIAGQEKERQKVANELHDDLGSLMATVKLHFDNVKVDQKDPAMKNAQDLLEKAYQKIRGMAHSKNSGVMANHGLLPAVQKMAKTINETSAIEVTVEDFGLSDRMENSLELTIFRIVQELMANIIKHAEATKASIQFTQHQDKLNIIVEDNGKGFDMANTANSSHGMGLGTIEKRIEHLEGTFTVDSLVGKGTSILIDIPI